MADSPAPNDAALLAALLADTQDAYARLLTLIDTSLQADFETQGAQALAFQGQIDDVAQEAQTRLENLRQAIAPWPERRKAFPAELAERVDHFLELLTTGLTALQGRVDQQIGAISHRRDELRQTMGKLKQQRQGIQGYRQKGAKSKLLNDKA